MILLKNAGWINTVNKNEYVRNSKCGTKELKAVPARDEHSTTSTSGNSFEYTVCPVDKQDFHRPLFPSYENEKEKKETKPVQATDHETDTLDSSLIATNVSTNSNPTIGTYLYSPNQPYRGILSSNISTSSATRQSSNFPSSSYSSERRHGATNASTHVAEDSNAYIPKPPRYRNYDYELNRTSTFQVSLWDVNNKPEIRTLVAYGFFYTGNGDLVRCFQCGIGLKDWVKDDDVLAEHIKHSSDCDFLKQKLGTTEIERLKKSLSWQGNTSGNRTEANSYKIRSPSYQKMESRIASFKSFPKHSQLNERTLAVAGLFYTGNGDLCRCFACDGGLKDWSIGDDPIQEHATYFPNCPYINQLKGKEYVNQMQARRKKSITTGTNQNGASSHAASQSAYSQASGSARNDEGAMPQVTQSFGALSMDQPSMENKSSSVLANQVFQRLGYTEQDVNTARAELGRNGNKNPTSEDIVNTILDLQERKSHQTENATTRDENKDDIQEILKENKRLLEIVHCKLCVTGEPDVLFLPCAHNKICHQCAENLTHCPICRQQIKEKIRTYRA